MRAVFISAYVVLLVVKAPEAWSAVINKDVCRKGAFYVGGQCLSFSTDTLSWHEAKKACSSQHGQLASLKDPYAVLAYVDHHYDGVQFWAGGSDITTEGNWIWVSGEPFVHFPWCSPNPNNYRSDQDCLVVNWNDGYDDQQCDGLHKYVCEYEVPGQVWRNDHRCGKKYLAPNGKPAECDPSGNYPCCSNQDWCGITGAHCECESCVDYREAEDSSEELECPEGFFIPPGSYHQCLKFFGEKRRNWFDANIKCGENGLRLAKPFNALALRAYLVERYGPDARVHVGARGTGSKMIWEHDGRELGAYNTLWRNSQPGNKVTTNYCLEVSAREYEMNQEPEKPYWPGLCSVEIFTLCEYQE